MEKKLGGGHRIKHILKYSCNYLFTLLTVLIYLLVFPNVSMANTNLHDKTPGTIVTFSGMNWMILDQKPDGTTYVILSSTIGNRVFDSGWLQFFNPSRTANIGYYLNNSFLNNLTGKDLIADHSWEIKYEDNSGSQANVTCKIALISYGEYNYYRSLSPPTDTGYVWWLRTPCTSNSTEVWVVNSNSVPCYSASPNAYNIRPALYLKSGIMLSDSNVVLGIGPKLPLGLTATVTAYNQVQLNWQANTESDLAGYIIYRDYNEIARVGAGQTTYTDNGLSPIMTYTYGIRAYSTSSLDSGMSNAATVMTTKPPAPGDLAISNITATGAKVTWNAVSGANSYNVYVDGSPTYNTIETQYDITGLSPETSHTVDVRTVVTGVESSPGTVSFTTLALPVAPTGLTATAVNYNLVQLSWDENSEPDLAGYIIYRNYNEIERVNKITTNYSDNGLQENTTYIYGIQAYNTSLITSGMSNAATVKTPRIEKPIVTAKVDNKNIIISWTGNGDNFLVMVNDKQVCSTTGKQYTYVAQPGSYKIQVIAIQGGNQILSEPVNVLVSELITPGVAIMTNDILSTTGLILYPFGSLIALGLGIKVAPWVITVVKSILIR